MNFAEFRNTLSLSSAPDELSIYLRALWYDARGDWDKAHTIIQDINDSNAAWIHAYLHRKEGDIGNADYCTIYRTGNWFADPAQKKKRCRVPL